MRTKCVCHNIDCDHEWDPYRDTPSRDLKRHRDPYTGEDMIYSRCPRCGTRWFAYKRQKRTMVTVSRKVPRVAVPDPPSTG